MTRLWIPFLPYAVISAVHVGLRLAEHPLDYPTKLLLMPTLALAVLWVMLRVRPVPRGATIVLVVSIACSWLGDGAAFFFPGLPELPMMLLSFGLAHLGYVFLIWKVPGIARGGFPRWSWIYVGAYLALIITLWPHTGSLLVPVMIYGLLLTATAAFAARCAPVVAWGGAWFLVSDAILAFRIFMPEAMPGWTSGAVMLTYTLGQGLLVYGIVSALRSRTNTGKVTPGGGAEVSVGSAG